MADTEPQLTPMMAQYRRIKGELPKDALLLFRLGDFYEMFFEDAQIGAQLLNVALTKRGVIPMCGIPFHAMNAYIGRLLRAGRKVAICEQLEEARPGQLVKREVTQILSPGTHFDERMLNAERNNYLAAVAKNGKALGLAVVDLTTGSFKTTEVENDAALLAELDRLHPAEIVLPSEDTELRRILDPASLAPQRGEGLRVRGDQSRDPISAGTVAPSPPLTPTLSPLRGEGAGKSASGAALQLYDDWVFAPETALFTVREHFKVASLDGFGLKNRHAAIGAAGAVLHYLSQHLRRDLAHLTSCSFYETSQFLKLDATTLRHLEILEPLRRDAPRNATLYGALNKTVTPMGARCMRDWLSQPLASVEEIAWRQEAVQTFLAGNETLAAFRAQLAEVRDLERTIGRLSLGSGNARDLLALRNGLEQVPKLKRMLAMTDSTRCNSSLRELDIHEADGNAVERVSTMLRELTEQLTDLPHVVELIARAIVDEPPLAVKEGGMIRDGFDPSLDELHGAQRDGKDWIARLQQQEIERTGISSLKVRFNSVFGYFIEVTKSNLDKVPAQYVRKQTIANGERFITPELKEMEGKILGAEERSVKLEYELFLKVREEVLGSLKEMQRTANALAQLDVLASFAETARLFDYSRPQVGDEGVLMIRDGRHPVLEQNATYERFVPNDASIASGTGLSSPSPHAERGERAGVRGALDSPDVSEKSETTPHPGPLPFSKGERETVVGVPQIALITGPNMAGKSTYIRQVALIALLAHTGSFVPAKEARIDLIDRIFTRIGASDDLARGQSTFMVEMCETANILNSATAKGLVVLDEIGRGTSTFDGLSLAWSIVEHLHNQVGAKTLFATHYHELTELAARLPRLKNFNVAVREWNDQIVFLRKIIEGSTDKSYGIQVARLAGVPKPVLERAKEILRNLEESELTPEGNVRRAAPQREREKLKQLAPPPQLDLFG